MARLTHAESAAWLMECMLCLPCMLCRTLRMLCWVLHLVLRLLQECVNAAVVALHAAQALHVAQHA